MYWLTHWFVTRVKCSVCGGQLLVGHSITAPAALCNYNGMAGNQGICAVNTRPPLTSTTTVYLHTVSNIQSKHAKLGDSMMTSHFGSTIFWKEHGQSC